ncbi:F0F1 ATP synthase subunit B [Clostridium thermobutyricum]|uniref:ATP synthase subunit b n=2 Tax=Clostridium thermobutyricum TaxID=29372 RepID=N9WAF4_9CLOT|nr:F0F1 ATP synthase subunit B [Clostridium thermobutyricum]ENY99874.1 ATP synthase F0, B subunit [Clostridium thermobutyricum]OPX47205.1 ATP synthase subunit b, sodium ion specific [Clostridium thermobutyricum DSM 4928]
MHIEISQVCMTIINFIILLLILRHFFWDKFKATIDERQKGILNKITSADNKVKEAEELRFKNEELLKAANEEGKKITEARKKQAEKIYNEIVEGARAESESIRNKASLEIVREREKAEFEIKEQVISLAIAVSKKALNESLNEEEHRKLINSFIDEVV